MKKPTQFFLFLFISFLLFCHCMKDSTLEPTEQPETIIPGTTKIISANDWQNYLVSISADSTGFTFKSEINSTYNFKVNDIIVSEGFIKKIAMIQKNNNRLIIKTVAASLTAAVEKGKGSVTTRLSMKQIVYIRKGVNNGRISGFEFVLNSIFHDEDRDPVTTDDQIVVSGSLLIDVLIHFDIEIENHSLKKMEIRADLNEEAALTFQAAQAFKLIEEIEIAKIEANPIHFFIGKLPVTITPVIVVKVGINGQASAALTTATVHNAIYTASVVFTQAEQWNSCSEFDNLFSYNRPTLNGNANSKAFVTTGLLLKFYNLVGPEITGILYDEIIADSSQTQLFIGANADIGIKMDVFDPTMVDYFEDALITYRKKIAESW